MISCKGVLRHRFFGTYSAAIVMMFHSPAEAKTALDFLQGYGFKASETNKNGIIGCLSTEALDNFKKALPSFNYKAIECKRSECRRGCKNTEIDSLHHSIDFGPEFTLQIDASVNQLKLAL